MLTTPDGGTRYCWKDNPELQIDAYKNKDRIFRDVYGRMSWDKPAPTITTRFNSLSNGRFGHPEEHRAISLREGATLQTFPKEYIFKGSNQASIARQIGNAVPPELAKRIGTTLSEHFGLMRINTRG
jgi:DNA (cytosine-5)-methyltransferase 1